ncbi:hypothetical protein MKO06_11575 [Gramella sp. GC03-9]|uniref:Histidine kinase/HSP90-like ATPase domain-containing protein n=1 Tax=Christiangramia oceanisediminis TaxID=2920386 RepID=A0A9X2KY92_9FLAO|nr:hypothetical protein [Gramella oceanisediminis]MCP9200552.1 hypothetical protein [Gramella oceanisediminis]
MTNEPILSRQNRILIPPTDDNRCKQARKKEFMRKIYIPIKVTSSAKGYELLIRLYDDLKDLQDEIIHLSLYNVQWFEANLAAVLGAIIENLENKNNKVYLVDVEEFRQKTDILYRNGFLPYYGIEGENLMNSSTQIPYKKFRESDHKIYNQYIQVELLDNPDFPKHSRKLGIEIKRNIYELFENARTHGRCKNIHTCGQFYPGKKRLHITIVDTGKTIINNVLSFLKKELSSSECIEWAMETGNTTKIGNTPGGLGLGLIMEFINLNKGKIQIVSSNGFWELRESKMEKYDLNFSFPGTIANLEFNLQEDKIYSFANETPDMDNIF